MKHPVDIYVGKKVRHRRKLLGLTQQQLGSTVGIKFQQVQKYESGNNRISASRLWGLSKALNVPIEYFFESLNDNNNLAPAAVHDLDPDVMNNQETLTLIRTYYQLPKKSRRQILELAKSLTKSLS